MPRLSKVLTVEGPGGTDLSVTVYELTVEQIISMMNDEAVSGEDRSTNSLMGMLTRNVSKCTSLTIEQAKKMAPSELKRIYEAFKEVNTVFFEVAREAGLLGLLDELKRALVEDFSKQLVGSLKQVMAKVSLAMDTPSS